MIKVLSTYLGGMVKEMSLSKNISFRARNVQLVINHMNKTKRNFSQTLNIILDEWDKFSLIIQKWNEQQHIDNIKQAKIINPMDERSKMKVRK